MEKADGESALKDFNEVLRIDPKNSTAYKNRSLLYDQQGRKLLWRAVDDWKQAGDDSYGPYFKRIVDFLMEE
jgi:Tfp pilus assembly protein PilF